MLWPLAVVVGLAVGLLLGAVNAVIVSRLKLPPFIATFGTLGIAAGLALYIANVIGHPVFPPDFVSIGNDALMGIPITVLLAVTVLIILEGVTRATTWGVHLRATGDNFAVARLSGVPVARVLASAYLVSGLLAAVAGTMLAARLGTANPLQGEPYTLLAVAACVIGGVDLFGGVATSGRPGGRHLPLRDPQHHEPAGGAAVHAGPRDRPAHHHRGPRDRPGSGAS